jgi:hypothetical protein
MMIDEHFIEALVTLVNAVFSGTALIIHAIRSTRRLPSRNGDNGANTPLHTVESVASAPIPPPEEQ